MAQIPPHQTNIVVTQVQRGGGGCLSGLGLGAGATCGGIAVVFVFFLLGGIFCFKTCERVGSTARQIAEERRKKEAEEAKKFVLVRWKIDDSVLASNKFTDADRSKKLIGIWVEVTVEGYETVAIAPENFSLEAAGRPYGQPFALVNPRIEATTLKPAGKITGGLAFEVPDPKRAVSLHFKPAAADVKNVRYETAK